MRLGAVSLFVHAMQTQSVKQARIFIKDSNFEFVRDRPSIMVGPGTGVVPFIAFIEERESLMA